MEQLILVLMNVIRSSGISIQEPSGTYRIISWLNSLTKVSSANPVIEILREFLSKTNDSLSPNSASVVHYSLLNAFTALNGMTYYSEGRKMIEEAIAESDRNIKNQTLNVQSSLLTNSTNNQQIQKTTSLFAPSLYQKTFNSYSGTDMVCSINVPGRGPVIFGELSQISYSVFREKVPVRAIGRVSMKGYTRGMRTVTGILGFTVFDESIVYRCMKEIKEQGYRMLMDEMPLFDVTISMANEYGAQSKMMLYGVSTYTEGMIMSVDDVMTQNAYEFYAIDIDPMQRVNAEKSLKYSGGSLI